MVLNFWNTSTLCSVLGSGWLKLIQSTAEEQRGPKVYFPDLLIKAEMAWLCNASVHQDHYLDDFCIEDLIWSWSVCPPIGSLIIEFKVVSTLQIDHQALLWHISTGGCGSVQSAKVWYGSHFHRQKVGVTRTEPYSSRSTPVIGCWFNYITVALNIFLNQWIL